MMNYESFKNEAEQKLVSFMPKEYQDMEVAFRKVKKVNEELDGLNLTRNGLPERISPTVYVERMYENYKTTGDFDECMRITAERILEAMKDAANIKIPNVDYETSKDNIVFQLINAERNTELLEKVPHRKFLDLALIYRCIVEPDKNGTASFMIYNSHMELIEMTEEEMFNLAVMNTKRLLKPTVNSMEEILKEIGVPIEDGMPIDTGMYILSNKNRVNGSVSMMYEENLYELANKLDSNLFILPSSIHELIVIASYDREPNELATMVQQVNATEVDEGEFLSDNVYFYNRESRKITISTN